MSLFSTVKASITTRQAAEFYGLTIHRNSMICCPFHPDKHPSMKVDARYYCFGCHETGDVIDFMSKLYGIRPYEAAKKLAADFNLDPNSPASVAAIPAYKAQMQQRHSESDCASILIDYECMLKEWKSAYAPTPKDTVWDIRFAEACKELPYITQLIEHLYSADASLRKETVRYIIDGGTLDRVQRRLIQLRKEESAHVRQDLPQAG